MIYLSTSRVGITQFNINSYFQWGHVPECWRCWECWSKLSPFSFKQFCLTTGEFWISSTSCCIQLFLQQKDQSLGQLEIKSTWRNFQQKLSLPEVRGTSRMNFLSVKAWCTSATHGEASQASHNWTQTKQWGRPNPLPEITEHLNNQGSTLILDVKMEKKKLMNKSKIFKTNKKEKWKNVELWWVLKCTVSFYMWRKSRELRLLFWC